MGARYYDPQGGRFISPDPIGYPINLDLYAYAGGDPINFHDPDGRFPHHSNQTTPTTTIGFLGYHLPKPSYLGSTNITQFNDPKITYDDSFENRFPVHIQSHIYDVGFLKLPKNMGIGTINGMGNSFKEAQENAEYISKLSGGYNIYAVYNATHGPDVDYYEILLGLDYIATEPVRQLHRMWNNFFDESSKDAMFLMICHSQGAIHVRNALLDYPEEIRRRILVVAIAPATYIDGHLCGGVMHFRAQWYRDPIPYLYDHRQLKNQFTVTTLYLIQALVSTIMLFKVQHLGPR